MTQAKAIPSRAEIAEADKWDLAALYQNDQGWEADFALFQERYPKVEQFRGTLAQSAAHLLAALEFQRDLDILLEKLYHYAHLRLAEDGADDAHLSRDARVTRASRAAEVQAFFVPELVAIEEDRFKSLIEEPALEPWIVSLEKTRRYRPHILAENEERLLAMASPVLAGHAENFSQLTDVDMRFGVIVDKEGREIELGHGAYSSLLQKRDRDLRRQAFHQYYREFADHRYTLAASLASSVRADVFFARARRFPSALEAALFSDNVPVAVYDNLIATVRENVDALHEYYDLRRDLLGLDEVHLYDTYVPLVPGIERRTTFDEAAAMVLASLEPLGETYVQTLRTGLGSRWCDRYESRGKRSGAFSSSSFGNPPYILMNFKEDVFGDVYTLAHEAGHSMHSLLSMRQRPFQEYRYPIFLAEVASTFNEELLTHHLLETTQDPAMRAYVINRQIEDIRGTLFRQTMFAEFEKIIHQREESGDALTLAAFQSLYRSLLETFFGPRFTLDDDLSLEALRIPHFYHAFYVYKYSTGIAAATALAQAVLADSSGQTRERYLEFLGSGGSRYPLDALVRAGVDMRSPEPVRDTIRLFRRRVAELRSLLIATA